jgi:hypothetical protein
MGFFVVFFSKQVKVNNSILKAWFMLEFIVLVLYSMRLHSLKQEKRKKIDFEFKMAPESKMDAEICFDIHRKKSALVSCT